MQITVHFWGAMARHAGGEYRTLEVPNPASVADAVQRLAADPALAGELSRCAYAIDDDIVGASHDLREGDELSVMPPVSGG
jgi:molybdopterin converting factor small subunit